MTSKLKKLGPSVDLASKFLRRQGQNFAGNDNTKILQVTSIINFK